MRSKKLLSLIILILSSIILYIIFMSTEFYMPKPKEIENPKQLASEIAKKIISDVKSDTLFLIVDNPSLICGSEGRNSRSEFLQKVDDLKYAIKTEYYFQKLESFEPFYKDEDRVIITGRSSAGPEGCGCFRSVAANFDSEAIKSKLV